MGIKRNPLVVSVDEKEQGFHYTQIIYNWRKDLIVCGNGKIIQNSEKKLTSK
jgi:hypothetical protein